MELHCYNCHGKCQNAMYCGMNQISLRCEICWAAAAKPTEHSPFCPNRKLSPYLSSSDPKHRAIDLLLIECDTDIDEFKDSGTLPTSIDCTVQSELHQHISYVFNTNRSISVKSPETIYWRVAFVSHQSILFLVNVTGRKFGVTLIHSPWQQEFKQIPLNNQVALVCFLSNDTKSIKLFGPAQSMELAILNGSVYMADDIPHEYERRKEGALKIESDIDASSAASLAVQSAASTSASPLPTPSATANTIDSTNDDNSSIDTNMIDSSDTSESSVTSGSSITGKSGLVFVTFSEFCKNFVHPRLIGSSKSDNHSETDTMRNIDSSVDTTPVNTSHSSVSSGSSTPKLMIEE